MSAKPDHPQEWAVILAAGTSERMGQPKQLLKLHGRTFADLVLDAVGARRALVVVSRPTAAAMRDEATLGGRDANIVFQENANPERGSWSSLEIALEYFAEPTPIVVLLADMPEVTRDITDRLVEQTRAADAWAAICEYDDGDLGHPIYLSTEAQQAAREHDVPNRLWSLLVGDPPHAVLRVPIDRPRPLDVDTPEEYVELLRRSVAPGELSG